MKRWDFAKLMISLAIVAVLCSASAFAQAVGQDSHGNTVMGTSYTEVTSLQLTLNPSTTYTVHCDCHITVHNSGSGEEVDGYICFQNNFGSQNPTPICTLVDQENSIASGFYGQLVIGDEWEGVQYSSGVAKVYCDARSSTGDNDSEDNLMSCHADPQ